MKKQFFSLALFAAAWLAGGSAQAWDEPSKVDDVYQLGSVNDVEWFSDYVQAGHTTIQAVLTADIDFGREENLHNPIGRNDTYKFNGKFDGQGHRIKNMIINRPNDDYQGFFGILRGGGTQVKNLIIDGSCSITGKNRVGGISGAAHVHGGAESYIENCINEANITATNGHASGILGAMWDNTWPMYYMKNCVNAGDINGNPATAFIGNCGSSGITGAVSGNGNSSVVNCVNLGTLTTINGNNNLFGGTYRNLINSYDLVITGKQGEQVTWKTANPAASGELCYYLNGKVGGGTNFYQTIGDDPYPVPFNTSEPVYEVADYYCDGTPKGSVTYSNTDGGSRDPHVFDPTTGLCTRCSYPKEDWMSASADGFYHISTPVQVEWFSHMVRDAGHGAMRVKLDNDIDFEDVANAHLPIGTNVHKFGGKFDGQGYRIKGMIITSAINMENPASDGVGFFGSVSGGITDNATGWETSNTEVVIENLIIDSSCSIDYDNHWVAGIVGHINGKENGGSVTIRNCGNEAEINAVENANAGIVGIVESTAIPLNIIGCWNTGNITATGKNIAGIFGGNSGSQATVTIKNCWNEGNIVGTNENATITAWVGSNSGNDVSGCYNIGQVTGPEGSKSLYRGTVTSGINNCDILTAAQEGKATLITADMVASGELCYKLNGDQSDIQWTQTLDGTQPKPLPDATGDQVFVHGQIYCTGETAPGTIYDNNGPDGAVNLDHNMNDEIGICEICYSHFQEPALVDGWYELKNAGNVEWFANHVNTGNLNINGKLMNDIDFQSIENLHTPIGISDTYKFNGTFDGQGYRIKNLIINRPTSNNQGFFGWLRGNGQDTRIENLIIDNTCSFKGNENVAALSGNSQNSGFTIYLSNIVNEANVEGSGQNVAAFVASNGNNSKFDVRNCVNVGNVKSTNGAPYAGAFSAWPGTNSASVIENFINLGKIEGYNGTDRLGRWWGTRTNVIDAGVDATSTNNYYYNPEAVTTGELTYYANQQASSSVFKQLIGTDYPSPFNTAEVLYVGAAGYSTMYDASNDWELNGDAQAYIGTINGSVLHLEEIDDIPAGTAVVISGTYYNKVSTTATATTTGNVLKGSNGSVTGGDGIYALAIKNEKVGFYPVAASVTIPAGKAYLEYTNTGGNAVKGFTFVFDEDDATGIQGVQGVQEVQGAIYNLSGQRISKMQKGINIVNGKKILK